MRGAARSRGAGRPSDLSDAFNPFLAPSSPGQAGGSTPRLGRLSAIKHPGRGRVDAPAKPGHDSAQNQSGVPYSQTGAPPHADRFIRATGSNPASATSSSVRTAPASSSFFAAM